MSVLLKHGTGPLALAGAMQWHDLTDLMGYRFPPPRPWDTELVLSHLQTCEEILQIVVSKYTPIEQRPKPVWVCQDGSWAHFTDQFYRTVEELLVRMGIKVDACERIVFVERYAPTAEDQLSTPQVEPILPSYNLYVYTRPS